MARYHDFRLQAVDTFKGGQPLLVRLRGLGVGHPYMQVVSHDHATDHRLDRRDPHKGTVRLASAQADDIQFMPFKVQGVALEHLRHDQLLRHVGAHLRAPECQLGVFGLVDMLDHRPRGHHFGIRERLGQGLQAEIVVRVAVADVDGSQVLAAGANLVDHLLGLGLAKLGVDQDGVLLATDQH